MRQLKKNLLSLAVAVLLVGASTASAQVAFQMSSLIRNVRLEGTTEAVGTVTLAATTAGVIVAGSTISLDYGTGIVDVPAPVNPVAISGGTSGLTSEVTAATVVAGGTGYTAGDVLTVVGGTFTTAATLTVAVTTGAVTGVTSFTGGRRWSHTRQNARVEDLPAIDSGQLSAARDGHRHRHRLAGAECFGHSPNSERG